MKENEILEALLKSFPAVAPQTDAMEDVQITRPAPSSESIEEQVETAHRVIPEEAEDLVAEDTSVHADTEVTETVSMTEDTVPEPIRVEPFEAPTQVITMESVPEESEEDFDGQMMLEDFAPLTTPLDDTPAEEEDDLPSWEEQLRETRREKIRDFQIKQNRERMDFRYAGESAPDEKVQPEQIEETPQEPEQAEEKQHFTGDFTDFSQAEDVRAELDHRYRITSFRLWLAAAAQVLLLWSEISVVIYGQPTVAPSLFLVLNLFLLTVMMALAFPMLRDGMTALVRLRPNADSVPMVVAAAAWLHAMLQWAQLPALERGDAPLYTAAAGLLLLLCGIGRLYKINRIRQNFTVAGRPREKFAATPVENERVAVEIGRRAVAVGTPRIAFFRPVTFLDDFLANSYMDDRYDQLLRRFIPVITGLSVVIGVVCGVVAVNVFTGVSAFVAALCVGMPAASLALNLPLYRECHRLLEDGNMLCGFAAAERFGDLHGVTLDISDLYMHDSVMLHGIRTFGEARIDEVILDAAAVAIRAEGPLSGLFSRIIENKTEILPPVENLIFEQDMGFSGWVGGRRVLVGNRKLLENHGVDTPSGDYERKYKKNGRELVYLSIAGALSAMYIISYVTDPVVEDALHRLQKAHLSLLVRSCDPNVTEESLCAGFHLDDYYLDLLTASAGRLYDTLRHSDTDRASAGAAVNGSITGIADLLTACRRLRRRGIFAMALQIIGALSGMIACFSAALSGALLPAIVLMGAGSLVALLSVVLPLITR